MPSNKHPHPKRRKRPTKDWTIMVFCAGDNALSPMIVSQLKDLKDAGGHDDVNVLVYFDANERGIPTRLYSINKHGQRNGHRNGHNGNHNGNGHHFDTYVQNLAADKLTINPEDGPAAAILEELLRNPENEPHAINALAAYLAFCQEQYRADHYALVLVGHGMIVGNDAFLPDEFPDSSITLKELGQTIKGFRGKLELLALHSCSMSAVEVAYELKGKANYMIASEGPAFVQGWPYRKLLKKSFELLDEANAQNGNGEHSEEYYVRNMVEELYNLSSSNGLDFMLSGYSQDLALINLHPDNFRLLTRAIKQLVKQLKSALRDESGKQLIQLAHLESQSYFSENYTDLYDFCFCLTENSRITDLPELRAACETVMEVLEPNEGEIEERFSKIVVHSRHFGSQYQYSHGLSVYFPWSKPVGDAKGSALGRYNNYRFTREFKENSWLDFLNLYLKVTEREARESDDSTSRAVNRVLSKYRAGELNIEPVPHKTSGATGPACGCASIKNYPIEKQDLKGKKCWMRKLTMSSELTMGQQ